MTEFYFKVKYIIIDFFLSQTMLLFLLLVTGHVKKWSPSISSASAYPNLIVNHQLYASERRLKADFKSIFS